eukprot:EG_transcript_31942
MSFLLRLLTLQGTRAAASLSYGRVAARLLMAYGLVAGGATSAAVYHELQERNRQRRPVARKLWEKVWAGAESHSGQPPVFQVGGLSVSEEAVLAVGAGVLGPIAAAYAGGGVRRLFAGRRTAQQALHFALRRSLLGPLLLPPAVVGSVGGIVGYRLARP